MPCYDALVQRTKSLAYSESDFSVIDIQIWHSLPYDILCTESLSLFKLNLYVILNLFNSFNVVIRFLFIFICIII